MQQIISASRRTDFPAFYSDWLLHRLADGHAIMRIKPLGAFAVVDAAGPEMDQGETVTLFNDMCLLAPGTLVDPAIQWEPVDARTAKARFRHAVHTISATLFFDDEGLLKDFVSDDRFASTDGREYKRWRWSTPIEESRTFGPYKLAHDAHVAPPVLADHHDVDDLLDLLDLPVDLRRADAHAAPIEHRVRAAVDHDAVVLRDLRQIAEAPDAGELERVLDSPEWQGLLNRLLDYVENYKHKIVQARAGFQM